jgi:hypothetical protein
VSYRVTMICISSSNFEPRLPLSIADRECPFSEYSLPCSVARLVGRDLRTPGSAVTYIPPFTQAVLQKKRC